MRGGDFSRVVFSGAFSASQDKAGRSACWNRYQPSIETSRIGGIPDGPAPQALLSKVTVKVRLRSHASGQPEYEA